MAGYDRRSIETQHDYLGSGLTSAEVEIEVALFTHGAPFEIYIHNTESGGVLDNAHLTTEQFAQLIAYCQELLELRLEYERTENS